MYKANSKSELETALKNKKSHIIINDERIIKTLKLLDNIVISVSNRNRCKHTLKKSLDGAAFLSSIGFAPMISELAGVNFLSAMGIISSVGLHEILTIFSEYSIKYKVGEIILSRI
jgi:transcriptional regulatory protein LevR